MISDYCDNDVIEWSLEVTDSVNPITPAFLELNEGELFFYTADDADMGLYVINVIAAVNQIVDRDGTIVQIDSVSQ